MGCPVGKEPLPEDCDVIEKEHTPVIIQGEVRDIVNPEEADYSPYDKYFTVTIYPRRGRVKYLKFKTKEERDKWSFEKGENYNIEGCLHLAGGKILRELIFNVTKVEHT